MVERSPEFELARHELAPRWDAERSAQLYAATMQLRRQRDVRRARGWAVATFAAAALLGAGLSQLHWSERGAAVVASRGGNSGNGHTVRLTDGSSAVLLGDKSEIEAVSNSPERIALKLVAGRAHFDVVPNPDRSFVVEAPPYRVQVVGTVFDVDRGAQNVRVEVTRGHVRVLGPAGSFDLFAGQARSFELSPTQPVGAPRASATGPAAAPNTTPREPEDTQLPARALRPRRRTTPSADPAPVAPASLRQIPQESAASSDSSPPAPAAIAESSAAQAGPNRDAVTPPPPRVTDQAWRSLSRSGQFDAAFESLRNSAPVSEDPAALMDAADAARLSGHPQSSVQYLTRVARDHPHSPVAPLAAFTLGRVYLEELGQPDRAAQAFELSRKLAPTGSMAQDALAREVEALSKAGNARKAFVRAQEYLQRYPGGRRLRAVQLYGGLD